MRTKDFDFNLPEALIAQTPLENRSESRLMVIDKQDQTIEHKHFYDILNYLEQGDVLVVNNTKVIPARLFGIKAETGAHVECLILKMHGDIIECLVGNAKKVKVGTKIIFKENVLSAICLERKEEGIMIFQFIYDGILMEKLDELGHTPLPPYIHEKLADKNRYQTVYAKIDGSAAAPTAGLHFTPLLLQTLKKKGVELVEVTLHVGLGTFRAVKVDDVNNHTMHTEDYQMTPEAAKRLNLAKQDKRRIISVGTTTTRVLETQMMRYNEFKAEVSNTDIFIYPGFEFKAIDALITNFHLPQSTLLMLVSALVNKEFILEAYQQAVNEQYRFFSFGDAMLIK